MSTVSFGFTSTSGGNVGIGNCSASKYTNSTGGYVTINQLRLVNVTVPTACNRRLAIYSDFPTHPYPHKLLGMSELKTGSLTVGDNVFLMPTPVVIFPGESVWFAYFADAFLGDSGGFNLVSGTDVRVLGNSGDVTTPPDFFFTNIASGFVDTYVPIIADGDNTAPTATTNVRSELVFTEPLSGDPSQVESNVVFTDVSSEGYPVVAANLLIVDSLFPVMAELPMSTIPFPGFGNSTVNPAIPAAKDPFNTALPGLAFEVHKKPTFQTNIKEAASGAEVRTSLTEYPRWEFELSYEFLEDSSGAESSLKTIQGFFMSRRGSYDSWLFKDPDDYVSDFGDCGAADGLTTQFELRRTMGGFSERVGQLDTANPLTVYHSVTQTSAIPAVGPYTIQVTNFTTFFKDVGVVKDGTTAMVKVASSPAAGQYSVDESTGTYTFNATDAGDTVEISYSYVVDNTTYNVVMPNLVVFDVAPSVGHIYASFQFFFACRFVEDQMDFEKFADKLWALRECNFRSIIQ